MVRLVQSCLRFSVAVAPPGSLVNVMSLTLFRNPVVGSLCALSYFDVIIQQFLQERSQRSIANQAYHMERATSG